MLSTKAVVRLVVCLFRHCSRIWGCIVMICCWSQLGGSLNHEVSSFVVRCPIDLRRTETWLACLICETHTVVACDFRTSGVISLPAFCPLPKECTTSSATKKWAGRDSVFQPKSPAPAALYPGNREVEGSVFHTMIYPSHCWFLRLPDKQNIITVCLGWKNSTFLNGQNVTGSSLGQVTRFAGWWFISDGFYRNSSMSRAKAEYGRTLDKSQWLLSLHSGSPVSQPRLGCLALGQTPLAQRIES